VESTCPFSNFLLRGCFLIQPFLTLTLQWSSFFFASLLPFPSCTLLSPHSLECATSFGPFSSFVALKPKISCSNRPPTLNFSSYWPTHVMCPSCTYFSKSWNFFVNLSTSVFAYTLFYVRLYITYLVMYSFNTSLLSKCTCSSLLFSSSSYAIIFSSCS
jgi:hypothetical protein